jgi:hypothetical protein
MSVKAIKMDTRDVVSRVSILQVPIESDGFQQCLRIGSDVHSFRTYGQSLTRIVLPLRAGRAWGRGVANTGLIRSNAASSAGRQSEPIV